MPKFDESLFCLPPVELTYHGLLFDMDGTIIDSTDAIVKHWHRLGNSLGVDPALILQSSHGRRSIDVLSGYNPKMATWDSIRQIEGRIPKEFGQDAKEIPGARDLLQHLESLGAPWMIVTSGTQPLVTGWLDVMQLARPKAMVTAEDVEHGKPDPACYLLGRERLGLAISNQMLVLEDSPAGIASGKQAGFQCVGLATTHSIERLESAGADWIVKDMRSITCSGFDARTGQIRITISNALDSRSYGRTYDQNGHKVVISTSDRDDRSKSKE